jgi:hypothetical protein
MALQPRRTTLNLSEKVMRELIELLHRVTDLLEKGAERNP